jgi:PHD/YefM family antitoxin component YafN of YafNO toxin-antitoxin module
MPRVREDHAPVVIIRRRDPAVVMMALDDDESLEETAYRLRRPRNAKRVREAVDPRRRAREPNGDSRCSIDWSAPSTRSGC